jgi:hypothetical protein
MLRSIAWRLAWLALLPFCVFAQSAADTSIPSALKDWRGWVLKGQEFRTCPFLGTVNPDTPEKFVCAWPSRLAIDAAGESATFAIHWQVSAPSWVTLPGDTDHWPQQVSVNRQRQPVVVHEQFPALYLQPGSYDIAGKFLWHARPQNLRVPYEIGLVALTIDGKIIAPLQRSVDVVTLGRGNLGTPESDAMQIRVYRNLIDDIPVRLESQIQIGVSGQAREEVLGPVLPEGFIPLSISSDWPVRLDDDGKLHVQVQPGENTITLRARANAPLSRVTARLPAAPWPKQETWSYAADPALRVTTASSVLQVDPVQAGVPNEWSRQPAFALNDGGVLTIEQRSRGLSAEEGNRLTLQREAWLSFDGNGWFARDHVAGTMVKDWRLDVAAPFVLERADAQNANRLGGGPERLLITQGVKPGLSGVEWRTPTVNLAAGVRVASAASTLPVSGWQDTFDRIDTTLHLPYGYRLLGAPGADTASGSWMSAWSLLDAFVCAILVLLAWRYLGILGGVVAAVYLLLGYQETDAPFWSLLCVAGLALIVRQLPAGRLRAWTEGTRRVALLALILVALPFLADQLRFAIYPQLESNENIGQYFGDVRHKAARMSADVETASPMVVMEQKMATSEPAPAPPAREQAKSQNLETIVVTGSKIGRVDLIDHYSESTVVQTGRGEPNWNLGSSALLSWSGPVLADQNVHLLIAPPWLVRPLRVLLVLLLGWLVWRLSRGAIDSMRTRAPLSAAALLVCGLAMTTPLQAQTIPSDVLLNQLQKRLSESPKCAPNCVGIAEALIGANGDVITVALDAQAIEAAALPLPVADASLMLKSVKVDGTADEAVVARSGSLWLGVARGVHRVELTYAAFADKVSLKFPLPPGRVQFGLSGWEGSGVADDHLLADTLNLTRTHVNPGERIAAGAQQFPTYVRVNRTVNLGLRWDSYTNVLKLAPDNGSVTVSIPLMANEHVASQTKTQGRNAIVAVGDETDANTTWSSNLDIADTLTLTAPPLTERAEVWRFVVSPTWHVEFSGVPETGGTLAADPGEANDYRQFVFAPLPGETLTVNVTRPAPVQGATRAIDYVNLQTDQGQHASTHTLRLQMRASQGGDHVVTMPADIDVLGVTRNNQALNLRPQDGKLTLPLTPGIDAFEIRFRHTGDLASTAHTPDIALGLPAANIDLSLNLPADRWLIATWGPRVGPAVLYWGELVVMVIVAYALSRTRRTKLRFIDWLLLGFGFSTFSWGALVIVVAWLFAFDWRSRTALGSNRVFNLTQVALAALTIFAVLCLVSAIPQGLLGQPDMHVSGYASDAHALRWFADRSEDALPRATAISIPMWVYKVLMLLWALWLANALMGWLRDAFTAWTRDGYWRADVKPVAPTETK